MAIERLIRPLAPLPNLLEAAINTASSKRIPPKARRPLPISSNLSCASLLRECASMPTAIEILTMPLVCTPFDCSSIFWRRYIKPSSSPKMAPRATMPESICSMLNFDNVSNDHANMPMAIAIRRRIFAALLIFSDRLFSFNPNFSAIPSKKPVILSDMSPTAFFADPNNPVISKIDLITFDTMAINDPICSALKISLRCTSPSFVRSSETILKTNVKIPFIGLNIFKRIPPSIPHPLLLNREAIISPAFPKDSRCLTRFSRSESSIVIGDPSASETSLF